MYHYHLTCNDILLKNNYLLAGRKVPLISRDEFEIFYFSSDKGASKIIVREFIEGNKATFPRLIHNSIFVLSHFRVNYHPISPL